MGGRRRQLQKVTVQNLKFQLAPTACPTFRLWKGWVKNMMMMMMMKTIARLSGHHLKGCNAGSAKALKCLTQTEMERARRYSKFSLEGRKMVRFM